MADNSSSLHQRLAENGDGTRGVRFAAVGDIMPGTSAIRVGWGMAERWGGREFSHVLERAKHLLADAEIALGNLECPLTATGEGGTAWHRDQMRADPDVAYALRDAGFTVMSVANNHAVQHGLKGFSDTVQALARAGILVAGLRGCRPWTAEPVTIEMAGVRVGILAYCWRPRQYGNETPPFAEGTLDEAIADVVRLKTSCDSIVVSLHWGDEFASQPSEIQVSAARDLVVNGANVVVGHHPHVVRPLEIFNGGIVAHSLGNFASDMTWFPDSRFGAVLRCSLMSGTALNPNVYLVEAFDDLCIGPSERDLPELVGSGLDQTLYDSQVSRGLQAQRLRAYAYAAVNFYRYQPPVLAQLLKQTIRNKSAAVLRRTFG